MKINDNGQSAGNEVKLIILVPNIFN